MICLLPHPSHEVFHLYSLQRKNREISIHLNIPKLCECFIPSAKTLIYTTQEQPILIQEEEMGRSQTM